MFNYLLYTYSVTWSQEDNEFVGLCVEFPSISFLETSPDKALKGIISLVHEVLEDLNANDEKIPVPLSHKPYSGKFQVRITSEQHRHLAIEAAEQKVSLNRYVASKLI